MYTYFVDVFVLLLEKNLIKESDEGIRIISEALKGINRALKYAETVGVPNCLALIGAFTHYTLIDKYKADKFLKWVQQNRLMNIPELHIHDVIDIYDKIYDSTPKKIFMSMWFNKKTEDTYKEERVNKIINCGQHFSAYLSSVFIEFLELLSAV